MCTAQCQLPGIPQKHISPQRYQLEVVVKWHMPTGISHCLALHLTLCNIFSSDLKANIESLLTKKCMGFIWWGKGIINDKPKAVVWHSPTHRKLNLFEITVLIKTNALWCETEVQSAQLIRQKIEKLLDCSTFNTFTGRKWWLLTSAVMQEKKE